MTRCARTGSGGAEQRPTTPVSPSACTDVRSNITWRFHAGWKLPGFDDSDWPAAHILDAGGGALPSRAALPSAPFTLLCGRPIPALTSDVVTADGWVRVGSLALRLPRRPPTLPRWHEAHGNSGSAVMLPAEVGEDEHMTIDFGRIVVGVPAITVSAAGPATVTIVAGEILDDRGVAEIRPRLQLTRLDVDGGGMPEEVTPFDSCGFRYVTLTSTTRLSVLSVVAIEERCPSDSSARFDSDDPELNRLWTMSRRTREVCATDAYVDCPTREDRAWLGDLYVHAMVGYVVDADQRMTRWALELGASQPRDDGLLPVVAGGDFVRFGDVIPDYSLHWIRALRQYWMHTGDDTTRALSSEGLRRSWSGSTTLPTMRCSDRCPVGCTSTRTPCRADRSGHCRRCWH